MPLHYASRCRSRILPICNVITSALHFRAHYNSDVYYLYNVEHTVHQWRIQLAYRCGGGRLPTPLSRKCDAPLDGISLFTLIYKISKLSGSTPLEIIFAHPPPLPFATKPNQPLAYMTVMSQIQNPC